MYICMYVCIYIHIHVYIHIYIYIPEWKCKGSLSLCFVSASVPLCFSAPVSGHLLRSSFPTSKKYYSILELENRIVFLCLLKPL